MTNRGSYETGMQANALFTSFWSKQRKPPQLRDLSPGTASLILLEIVTNNILRTEEHLGFTAGSRNCVSKLWLGIPRPGNEEAWVIELSMNLYEVSQCLFLLKAPISTFTIKNLLRHHAKRECKPGK